MRYPTSRAEVKKMAIEHFGKEPDENTLNIMVLLQEEKERAYNQGFEDGKATVK